MALALTSIINAGLDGDGIGDLVELDTDNTGLRDCIEFQLTTHTNFNDQNDGEFWFGTSGNTAMYLDSRYISSVPTLMFSPSDSIGKEINRDDTTVYIDPDSDSDCLSSAVGSGLLLSGTGANASGVYDDASIAVSYTNSGGLIDSPATQLDNSLGVTAQARYCELFDNNGGGFSDSVDSEDTNNGIHDITEGSTNSDNEATPNYFDCHSDNNGIPDANAGSDDFHNDGITDYPDDNLVDNALEDNVDDDGVSSSRDFVSVSVGVDVIDNLILNSDKDGLSGALESNHLYHKLNGKFNYTNGSTLSNELINAAKTTNANPNRSGGGTSLYNDSDGLADFLDVDSDNDNITDAAESFGILIDQNGDVQIDNFTDNNGDGVDDSNQAAHNMTANNHNGGRIDDIQDYDANGLDDGAQTIPMPTTDDGYSAPDLQNRAFANNSLSDLTESATRNTDGDRLADGIAIGIMLPDSNGDDTADFRQLESELTIQPDKDIVNTVLKRSGCSIGGSNNSVDPILPSFLVQALLWQTRRYRRLLWLILPLAAFASGCTLPKGPYDDGESSHEKLNNVKHFGLTPTLYAGAGVGLSHLEPDTSAVASLETTDRVNNGGQVTLGVDIAKYLAIEAHSADLGSAGIGNTSIGNAGLSPSGRINYHIDGVSAIMYVGGKRRGNLRRGLTGFARVGFGALENTPVGRVEFEKSNATHVLIGAGVEYNFRSGLGARAELISFDKDVGYGQLGIIYRYRHSRSSASSSASKQAVQQPTMAAAKELSSVATSISTTLPTQKVNLKRDSCLHQNRPLKIVSFSSNSAQLSRTSTAALDSITDELKMCPKIKLTVAAHTDGIGSREYNQELSESRVWSVLNYLRAQGIERNRLSPRVFGETKPIASNTSVEGRQRNRRVELF